MLEDGLEILEFSVMESRKTALLDRRPLVTKGSSLTDILQVCTMLYYYIGRVEESRGMQPTGNAHLSSHSFLIEP